MNALKPIVQNGTPVLRGTAAEVPLADITSPRIKKILADMKAALEHEPDGAALAAPQIGVPLRIFMVAQRVFGTQEETERKREQHLVYINPTMVRRSKKLTTMEEGCLSVRGYYGTIKRSPRATVRAYDETGKPFTRGASGLLAQVFQHEIDHLDGTLFIDHADRLWEVEAPEKK